MVDETRPPNELGNVLVSLQKAFSRVSRDSANVPSNQARALVVGKVSFDMSMKCESANDSLLVASEGGIELRLTGTLEVDVRPVVGGPDAAAATAPQQPAAGDEPAGVVIRPIEVPAPEPLQRIIQEPLEGLER